MGQSNGKAGMQALACAINKQDEDSGILRQTQETMGEVICVNQRTFKNRNLLLKQTIKNVT
jgi:hypothetical protein